MADSPTTAAVMAERDTELATVLPIGPVMPNNLDVAKTLPFYGTYTWEEKRDLRAACLERTKQRWAWFSDAEDQDRERGTQLGTLGYLPWEIRQMVFENVISSCSDEKIYYEGPRRVPELHNDLSGIPDFWHDLDVYCAWDTRGSVSASASMRLEVTYAYITTTEFEFESIRVLSYFLGRLTKYEKSLLRSVTIPLPEELDTKGDSEIMRDACKELPSGLKSITFKFVSCEWATPVSTAALNFVDSLDLLGKQIRRCWAPRAKISICPCHRWYCGDGRGCEVHYQGTPLWEILASAFNDLEPWSQGWLDWWASSQNHDQAEEQSALSRTRLVEPEWFMYTGKQRALI